MNRIASVTSFVKENFTASKRDHPSISHSHEITPKGNVIVTHTCEVLGEGSKFFKKYDIPDSDRSSSDFKKVLAGTVSRLLEDEKVFPKDSVDGADRFWYEESLKKHLDVAHKPVCVVEAGGNSQRPVIIIRHNLIDITPEVRTKIKRYVTLQKMAKIPEGEVGKFLFK